MLGGAIAVLVTGQISPADAVAAINTDVMLFLFGMFVVGEALVESGYLDCIAHRLFSWARNTQQLVFAILFSMGVLSAILMNDTLAIIGTPIVLALAVQYRVSAKLLLMALAVGVTTGSVMSPIGNPQNLLVASGGGLSNPFVAFGSCLILPTAVSLLAAWIILRLLYRDDFTPREIVYGPMPACDRDYAMLVQCSLAVILLLISVKVASAIMGLGLAISLASIALFAALPVLLFSRRRFVLLKNIDWYTLVFFAAMFVLMESVWKTGFFQSFVAAGYTTSVPAILAVSVVISQFISNVPFVALFQPLILQAGGGLPQLMALAAGTTIAGNLTIIGAASNVIIIQHAEKENHGQSITFLEFAKIGIPLTIINLLVYLFSFWIF